MKITLPTIPFENLRVQEIRWLIGIRWLRLSKPPLHENYTSIHTLREPQGTGNRVAEALEATM
jgi:hypothetical protein